jgi:hypothetical protein
MLPEVASFAQSLGSPSIRLDRDLLLRVLGEHEVTVTATAHKLIGRRLIVQIPVAIPLNTCIGINSEDEFLLGEVRGCWCQCSCIFGAIELHERLGNACQLPNLYSVFERFFRAGSC